MGLLILQLHDTLLVEHMTSVTKTIFLTVIFLMVLQIPNSSGQEDGKNRMVFEPGSDRPDIHESANGEKKESAATEQDNSSENSPNLITPPRKPDNLPDSISSTLDVFFGQLIKGNVDGAYNALTNETVIANTPADIVTLKEKTRQAFKLFGEVRGYEILRVREVGEHLLEITCISLGELYPLRWIFIYYMPQDSWTLIDIRVDDGLSDLFPDGKNRYTDKELEGS